MYPASVFFSDTILGNNYIRLGISNTIYLPALFFVLRMWLLYFDHEKHKQLLAYKWKSQLNNEVPMTAIIPTIITSVSTSISNTNSNKNNESSIANYNSPLSSDNIPIPWAIKYQHLFENSTKMHLYCVVCWIVIIATNMIVFSLGNDRVFLYVQTAWLVVISLMVLFGANQIRRCHDELNIRRMLYLFQFVQREFECVNRVTHQKHCFVWFFVFHVLGFAIE